MTTVIRSRLRISGFVLVFAALFLTTFVHQAKAYSTVTCPDSQDTAPCYDATTFGAVLNTNINGGGGTDDTIALQTGLNFIATSSPTGGTLLIRNGVTGYALISGALVGTVNPASGHLQTTALQMTSNVTIDVRNSGVFLATSSNVVMLGNSIIGDQTTPKETNMTVIGGIWNGDGINQSKGELGGNGSVNMYLFGFWFGGFTGSTTGNGVTLKNLEVLNAKNFSIMLSNGDHFTVATTSSVWDSHNSPTDYNHDGFHMWGPLDTGTLSYYTDNSGNDDSVAFNTDEGIQLYIDRPTAFARSRFSHGVNVGALTNITVDHLTLSNPSTGIAFYGWDVPGGNKTVDHVKFDHVSGSVSANSTHNGVANEALATMGTIEFDNWGVTNYGGIGRPDAAINGTNMIFNSLDFSGSNSYLSATFSGLYPYVSGLVDTIFNNNASTSVVVTAKMVTSLSIPGCYNMTDLDNVVHTSSLPLVDATPPVVKGTQATLNGGIACTAGKSITHHGFIYGTDPSLVGGDTVTTDLGASGTTTYSQNVSGLSANTTYYYTPYAAYSSGTSTVAVPLASPLTDAVTGGVEPNTQLLTDTGPTSAYYGSTLFDGTHQYGIDEKQTSSDWSVSPISIGVWVRLDASQTFTTIAQIQSSEGGGWGLGIATGRTVQFTESNGGGDSNLLSTNTSLNLGQWYYIVATDDGAGNHAIYVNGILDNSDTSGAQVAYAGTLTQTIGNNGFTGALSELSVWNAGLSGTDVTNLWNGTTGVRLVGNEAGLSSLFHLDGHGTPASFTTLASNPSAPTVTTAVVNPVAQESATLNGSITVTGGQDALEHGFAWGTSSTLSGSFVSTTTDGAFTGTGSFTYDLTAITCGTTFYARAYATNAAGTSYGIIRTFSTTACTPPTTFTAPATSVTKISATLNGSVGALGGTDPTLHGFAWGTSTSLTGGNVATTTDPYLGAGGYTHSLSGLSCGTTYYSRAYATNGAGTGFGSTTSSVTSACTLTVSTAAVTSIGQTSATLNGSVDDNSGSNATQHGFAWGTVALLSGGDTATTSDGAFVGTGSFTDSLSSLTCNTAYYSRAYAFNSAAGTSTGIIRSFTTSACPSQQNNTNNTTPPPAVGGSVSSGTYNPPPLAVFVMCPANFTCTPISGAASSLGAASTSAALTASTTYAFTRDLQLGDVGQDVRALQMFLNQHGFILAISGAGSPGHETTYFGLVTRAAVIKFQRAHGVPGTGYFGPLSRKAASSL